MVSTRHNIARLRQLFAPIGATTFVGLLLGCQHVDETALQNISDAPTSADQVRLVERDVESPEVFDIRAAGLWDGAPTLGGIWVAHPDLKDPIRVVIRNLATKKFVIGNLFRNDPKPETPVIRISSDAARALGIRANDSVQLSVTALSRVSSAATTPSAAKTISGKPVPVKTPHSSTSPLAKPYLQLGMFKIKANAMSAANSLDSAGTASVVKPYTHKGETLWRVLIGPAQTVEKRKILLALIRSKGFSDAYAVSK